MAAQWEVWGGSVGFQTETLNHLEAVCPPGVCLPCDVKDRGSGTPICNLAPEGRAAAPRALRALQDQEAHRRPLGGTPNTSSPAAATGQARTGVKGSGARNSVKVRTGEPVWVIIKGQPRPGPAEADSHERKGVAFRAAVSGAMFWLTRNRLFGSHVFLSATSPSNFAGPYAPGPGCAACLVLELPKLSGHGPGQTLAAVHDGAASSAREQDRPKGSPRAGIGRSRGGFGAAFGPRHAGYRCCTDQRKGSRWQPVRLASTTSPLT